MKKTAMLLALLISAISFVSHAQDAPNAPLAPSDAELWPAKMACGLLPIVRIATEGGVPVLDKETKIPASLTFTAPTGYSSMCGSEPMTIKNYPVTIKGRGNKTWLSAKKPYKLKFQDKIELAGLPEHKHFSLIPFPGYLNYVSATAGLYAARCVGMEWTPGAEPVELILNDVYMGRYFVVENIKISKNRLDIFEQEDMCTDQELIPYGWLVEIDNNEDQCQIRIPENEKSELRVTYHSPENLSKRQYDWLTDEFAKLNEAINADDPTGESWARYIDATSAAQYFIVRELFGDPDAYSGSMYLHRDKGENAKWHFGPIWDVASTHSEKEAWIIDSKVHYGLHWFPQIMKTEAFRNALKEQWTIFRAQEHRLYAFLDNLAIYVGPSDEANHLRWKGLESSASALRCAIHYKQLLSRTIEWIDRAVNDGNFDTGAIEEVNVPLPLTIDGRTVRLNLATDSAEVSVYTLAGRLIAAASLSPGETHTFSTLAPGIYILRAAAGAYQHPASTRLVIR